MSPNFLTIRRVKLLSLWGKLRLRYYKALGLRYSGNCRIGRIKCDWPNNVTLGEGCVILDGVILGIGYGFEKDKTIEIGDRVYIGYNVEFNCTNSIKVGNDVLIATGTKIVDVGHNFQLGEKINRQPLTSSPIIIEDDVWIAANTVIVGGVTIGKGSVVAAGSIVTRSIPPNEVWGGVPARYIKKRN